MDKNAFVEHLHAALLSLYDNAALRKNPLVDWLGLAGRPNPVLELQETLTAEIHKLKPGFSTPLRSSGQRVYLILQYRFIEQLGQKEAAAELLLSVRHLRRLEGNAIRELSESLWRRYHLDRPESSPPRETSVKLSPTFPNSSNRSDDPLPLAPPPPMALFSPAPTPIGAIDQELAWARESLPDEAVDLSTLVSAIMDTLRPLLSSRQVRLLAQVDESLPPVWGKTALIRQALFDLAVRILERCQGGDMLLQAGRKGEWVAVSMRGTIEYLSEQTVFDLGQVTYALVEAFGGKLSVSQSPAGEMVQAQLLIPAAQTEPVLVVDDNLDALQLAERFLAGSLYQFVGVRNPAQVVEAAEKLRPRAIVLDVMLPGVDGWELLGRLREHPATCRTPVVVCTFLDQKALALALGAAAFLRKPLTREGLLAIIDHVTRT